MSKAQIVIDLVETRVNGNSIKGNATYESMVKRVTKQDLINYANVLDVCVHGNQAKLAMIESMREKIDSLR